MPKLVSKLSLPQYAANPSSPAAGDTYYNTTANTVYTYNGTTWIDLGLTGDITAVSAGTGLSGGGTSGDVTLSVNTNVVPTISGNTTVTFTASGATGVTLPTSGTLMTNPMTTANDTIYGGTSGTPTRLANTTTSGHALVGTVSSAPSWVQKNAVFYSPASSTPASTYAGDLWIVSDQDAAGSASIVDSVTSTVTTAAASANAVKLAYDTASSSGNILINGAMDVWQRGTSFAAAGYTADRWVTTIASGQTIASSQQSFTPGTAPVSGYESAYFLRNSWSGTPSGTYWLSQRVEDVRTFAGQTVTLSYWAKASSSTSALSMVIEQNFGSGGSSVVTTTGSTVSLTTSWTRFSQTFNVPSISGKTIGTSSYLDVRPFVGSTSVNGLTIDIWGVQLESGSVATGFFRSSNTLAGEISACQRYYYRIAPGTTSALFAPGYLRTSGGTTNLTFIINFPVLMRTAPSALETTGTAANYEILYPTSSGESSQTLTAVPVYSETGVTSARVTGTTGTLATGAGGVGTLAMLRAAATAAYLGWSAEL